MKVAELMSRNVQVCRADHSLQQVAAAMWNHDCGCVPVVDGQEHVVGMITDRDVCMGALSTGRPLHEITVAQVMSTARHVCREDDSVDAAQAIMRSERVRRLPVLDGDERIVGVLSVADLAREGFAQPSDAAKRKWGAALLSTLGSIATPHDENPGTLRPRAAPKVRAAARGTGSTGTRAKSAASGTSATGRSGSGGSSSSSGRGKARKKR